MTNEEMLKATSGFDTDATSDIPEHFNGLTPAEHERLSLLFEEASEVIQVVGKIMRHGLESTHPDGGPTNRELLEKELGDLKYAEGLLIDSGDIGERKVFRAMHNKAQTIERYLHHQE